MLAEKEINNRILVPSEVIGPKINRFYGDIEDLLRQGCREIVIDCSNLKHAVSSNIYIIWKGNFKCQEAGTLCRLTNVSDNLKRVLKVLDLYDLLVIDQKTGKKKRKPDVTAGLNVVEKEIDLKFEADEKAVSRYLTEFRDYLKNINLPELLVFELETVFYEVTTNILQHSGAQKSETIIFTANSTSEYFRMKFNYPGVHFNPTVNRKEFDPNAAIQGRQKRGYGLMLINRMMDTMTYQRSDDQKNILTLEKRWN